MTQIDEQSRHRQPSRAVAIDMAARQRLAVRVMALPAVLAMFATLVQIYDGVSGKGSFVGRIRLNRDRSVVAHDRGLPEWPTQLIAPCEMGATGFISSSRPWYPKA